MRSDPA
jgi:hypothetical protein